MAGHSAAEAPRIEALFADQTGYPTPKIDVRAAVFDGEGRILMVRERIDGDRWTLPGGWADVTDTLRECVEREVREESGYTARALKLAAAWDRARQGHPPSPFACAKLFYLCELTGGAPATSLETAGVGWFREDALPAPEEMSLGRVLPGQVARMFAHWRAPELPTEFE